MHTKKKKKKDIKRCLRTWGLKWFHTWAGDSFFYSKEWEDAEHLQMPRQPPALWTMSPLLQGCLQPAAPPAPWPGASQGCLFGKAATVCAIPQNYGRFTPGSGIIDEFVRFLDVSISTHSPLASHAQPAPATVQFALVLCLECRFSFSVSIDSL